MPNPIKFNYLKGDIHGNVLNWLYKKAEGFFFFGCLPAAARAQTPAAVPPSPAPTGAATVSCKNDLKQTLKKIYCASEGTEPKGKLSQMLQKAPKYCNTGVLPIRYLQATRQYKVPTQPPPSSPGCHCPRLNALGQIQSPRQHLGLFPGARAGPMQRFSSPLPAALPPSRPRGSPCSCVPEIKGSHQLWQMQLCSCYKNGCQEHFAQDSRENHAASPTKRRAAQNEQGSPLLCKKPLRE